MLLDLATHRKIGWLSQTPYATYVVDPENACRSLTSTR